jgi:hypothetical protein
MAEPHDLLKARRESAALLGLGDVERLSPADTLRCDLISTLRLAIDGEQATVLDGGAADLAKLITATENLIRLLPGHELPEPKPADGGPNDPRTIMWETYISMRRRGELAASQMHPQQRLEAARAKVAEIEAELAALAPLPDEPLSTPPAPTAPAGNVVPLREPPSSEPPLPKSAPAARRGILTDDEPEPWRPFVTGGAHYDRWSDRRT